MHGTGLRDRPAADRRRLFFLFCSAANPDADDVAQCVEEYCETRRPPDAIYLIARSRKKRR